MPAIEHAKHSSNCGWAVIHATAVRLQSNHQSVIEDPRGIPMYEARKMTYGNHWPHEKKKGWIPKVGKVRNITISSIKGDCCANSPGIAVRSRFPLCSNYRL